MFAKQVLLSISQSLNILLKISPFAAKEAGAKLCGLARDCGGIGGGGDR